MKAARYHRTDHGYLLQSDDVPVPTCGENEVRLRVAFCGICGSDLARYRQRATPSPDLESLFGRISSVPGHEFSGVVDEIGARVNESWQEGGAVIGSRVTVHPLVGCGECPDCRADRWNRCAYPERSQVIGVHRDGGFAEWVVVPFDHVVRVSDEVALAAAALTEPLAVALHAVAVAALPSSPVPILILGDGPVGLLIAHVLWQQGQPDVRVVGRHPGRLEIARRMGAYPVQNASEIEHPADLAAEFVFQVAGSPAALEMGTEMLAGNGQMICLGYVEAMGRGLGAIPFNRLIRNEQTLRGSFGSSRSEFEGALRALAAGEYDVTPLIAGEVPLDDIVAGGFEALLREPRPGGKILVRPEHAGEDLPAPPSG